MERSHPTLIPEWLKSNGSLNGGGNSFNQQHSSSSSSHSDDKANVVPRRNNYSFGNGGSDSPRSVFVDSSYFNRKPASNGSMMHDKNRDLRPFNSFVRRRSDRDWDTEEFLDLCNKDRCFPGDSRDRYATRSGESVNSFKNRSEANGIRRSQSMISERRGELWSRRTGTDLRSGNNNYRCDAGGIMAGSCQSAASKRDFPSFRIEERPGTPDIARVSSPSLSSPVQSSSGASAVIGDDGWTSALAELPVIAGSNSGVVHSSDQQNSPARLSTVASCTTSGLNMAETLAQAPSRAHSAPQISVETQRLEELAIRQSRQLIPLTSLVPKTLVLKSEKPKLKPATRSETNPSSKSGHHQLTLPHLVSGPTNSDIAKSWHVGKLHVLKPAQERNGISSHDKYNAASSVRVGQNLSAVAPLSTIPPLRSSNNPKRTATEHNASSLRSIYAPTMEKRPTLSQTQSRSDFFKLMRKKSSTNLSSTPVDPNHVLLNALGSSGDSIVEVSTAVASQVIAPHLSDSTCHDWSTGNGATLTFKGSQTSPNNREKCSIPFEAVYLDEEEKAFLFSLGWDENAGEDEGLTEEEISAFYKEHMPVKPSLKINFRFEQPKCLAPLISHLGSFDSTELSSSDSDTDSDA